jgi:hypothetical protein
VGPDYVGELDVDFTEQQFNKELITSMNNNNNNNNKATQFYGVVTEAWQC